MKHDKTKTCKDCPDRTIEPKCHDTCQEYKARIEKQLKNRQPADEAMYVSYFKAAVRRMKGKKA